MGNAGSILKGLPDFGRVPLLSQVTAADIVGSKGRYEGAWVDMNVALTNASVWGTPSTTPTQLYTARLAHALLRKAHFPMDLDMAGCSITFEIQGRLDENDPNVVTLLSLACNASTANTVLAQSDGSSTGAANPRSQQHIGLAATQTVTGPPALQVGASSVDAVASDDGPALQVFPQMRAVLHTFQDTGTSPDGDQLKATYRAWPINTGGTLTDYCPVGVTADATEGLQVLLPSNAPWVPNGGMLTYPVLVIVKTNATAYNNHTSIVSGGGNDQVVEASHDDARMAYDALSRGWAVVSIAATGINITPRSSASAWRHPSLLDYSLGTVHDPRKDVAWAMQWVRTVGQRNFNLNPQMTFLWGEYDAASLVYWHVYGNGRATRASTTLSLRADDLPNLVGGRNPEVDWTMPANALRCPLLDAAGTGVATTIAGTSLAQRSANSIVRQLTRNGVDNLGLQVPFYCIADGNNTLVAAGTSDALVAGYVPGDSWAALSPFTDTGYYAPTTTTLGTQVNQYDNMHCFVLKWAAELVSRRTGHEMPFAQHSHLHVQAAAQLPTAPILVDLVNSSGSESKTAANVLALRWAESIFRISTPQLGPQAVFDVEILL